MKVTGKAYIYGASVSVPSQQLSLDGAMCAVKQEIEAEASENDILAAHLEILEDPLLEDSLNDALSRGLSPLEAVDDACTSICAMFDEIDDELIKSRANDVRDVCGRLKMKIQGSVRDTDFPEGCILVAKELFPSDMQHITPDKVRGILCQRGNVTDHAAILARSKGIPIQFGVDVDGISQGDSVSVEDRMAGDNGIVEQIRKAGRKVYANAGSIDDIQRAMQAGADGIGLLRTEFLYLQADSAPSFESQRETYIQAMLLCKGKTLTIRTMDIGGDKVLKYLEQAPEDNPFLGLRGIRLSLAHPDLFEVQLKAIAAAAARVPECRVRVMLPMVCNASEVATARALMNKCMTEVASEMPHIEFGAMVETPAAALDIASLCSECDFFSIGSNDLTQYVMATDRGNASVAYLYDTLSAPVKYLISKIVSDAHANGVEAGICGEAASDPAATSFFLETGMDSLSLNRL